MYAFIQGGLAGLLSSRPPMTQDGFNADLWYELFFRTTYIVGHMILLGIARVQMCAFVEEFSRLLAVSDVSFVSDKCTHLPS